MNRIDIPKMSVGVCQATDDHTFAEVPGFDHSISASAYYLLHDGDRDVVCVEIYEGKLRILVVNDPDVGLEPIYERPLAEVVIGK